MLGAFVFCRQLDFTSFEDQQSKNSNMIHVNLTNLCVATAFSMAVFMTPIEAIAQTNPPTPGACEISISNVITYNPGKRRDGSIIPAAFTSTARCLGVPQDNDSPGADVNYVSLGFGGEIVVQLSGRITDGTGADLRIVETTPTTTNCSRIPEKVEVFGSQDGCNFVCLGSLCQDGNLDLSGSGLEWIRYVKLHDISPVTHPFNNDLVANGFDLDGISCLSGAASPTLPINSTYTAMYPRTYLNYLPANPSSIPVSRRNPLLATGAPENNNGSPITFTSLGFGGEITLVFDYLVFDKEGPDLQVIETSGAGNYPEKAEFYGSSCGNNWVLLNITQDGNVLEQDGWIDFGGTLYSLKYLRIIDRSKRTQFTGAADGYDVDGVSVINGSNCLSTGSNNSTARFEEVQSSIPDEAGKAEMFPNPFSTSTVLTFTGGSVDEVLSYRITNIAGQQIVTETISISASEMIQRNLDLSAFPAGIYLLEVSGEFGREVYKLMKN